MYLHAVAVTGVAPAEVALVAAHAWDIHGAKNAGLATGWVQRAEPLYAPSMAKPDVTGTTLNEVCEKLISL